MEDNISHPLAHECLDGRKSTDVIVSLNQDQVKETSQLSGCTNSEFPKALPPLKVNTITSSIQVCITHVTDTLMLSCVTRKTGMHGAVS